MQNYVERSYGLEAEKTFVIRATGEPLPVGSAYFDELATIKATRGASKVKRVIDGAHQVGIETEWGTEGLDGSFHIGESSTVPISESEGGLRELARRTLVELGECQHALNSEKGSIINMSNNPLVIKDDRSVKKYAIPRPESYARQIRGWDHAATIDACVQNSPSTSVNPFEAADAMTVTIGLGAVFIALFANSPFSQGALTGLRESRLKMWEQYFAHSTVAGDQELIKPPVRPFYNLRDYFEWIYSHPRSLYFVMDQIDSYEQKMPILIQDNPAVLDYIRQDSAIGTVFPSGKSVQIKPKLGHFERNQFMQFFGARLRFTFRDANKDARVLSEVLAGEDDEVERFMADECSNMYIEGRDPGATFADNELEDTAPATIRSVFISPSALQGGLLGNLRESKRIISQIGWDNLMGMREAAIHNGIRAMYDGIPVANVVDMALAAAAGGLAASEHWMLEYPEHVLRTNTNGADRLIKRYELSPHAKTIDRIRSVVVGSQITDPFKILAVL
jgi:hypothetical protein